MVSKRTPECLLELKVWCFTEWLIEKYISPRKTSVMFQFCNGFEVEAALSFWTMIVSEVDPVTPELILLAFELDSPFLVTRLVHYNKVLADALLNSSTFSICFADLCLTNAHLPIFPKSKADWHTLYLKLCILFGSANNHDSNGGSVFQFKLKLVYFILNLS